MLRYTGTVSMVARSIALHMEHGYPWNMEDGTWNMDIHGTRWLHPFPGQNT